MGKLTDTHCHLDFDAFDEDRAAVIGRAKAAGVSRMLNPGIDLETSALAVKLAEDCPEVFAAVGVHPNSATGWNPESLARLRWLCQNPRVVAIGEIGLDYYRERTPREKQIEVFRLQLALAAQEGKPVVIHNREASNEVLKILAEWHSNLVESGSSLAERPGVLHSFSGNPDHAAITLEHNFLIGVTGPVTFKNASTLQDLVKSLPLESLLIETDAPFLSPHPMRGKRNEPANVQWVLEKIAALKGLHVEVVQQKTYENAARLFEW